ncbi:MAG: hypothetical protein Q9174_005154 [Haloplaca sp. 1 TL-2023]
MKFNCHTWLATLHPAFICITQAQIEPDPSGIAYICEEELTSTATSTPTTTSAPACKLKATLDPSFPFAFGTDGPILGSRTITDTVSVVFSGEAETGSGSSVTPDVGEPSGDAPAEDGPAEDGSRDIEKGAAPLVTPEDGEPNEDEGEADEVGKGKDPLVVSEGGARTDNQASDACLLVGCEIIPSAIDSLRSLDDADIVNHQTNVRKAVSTAAKVLPVRWTQAKGP